MTPKRLKRETPSRSGPTRNRVITAQPEPARAGGPVDTMVAAMDQGLKTARMVVETANATVIGAVERGVNTAYMVIEEYMLRGRQAAARQQERSNGGNVNDNRPSDSWAAAWGPMAPMMAPWMQMMRMWTDSMSALVPGGQMATQMATQWMNQFVPPGSGWSGLSRPNISVQVSSQHPAEVTVVLAPGAENLKLTVDPLTPVDGESAPPLAGTRIESLSGRVRVCLTVPNDQPAGRYSGVIRDDARVKRGELTVEIEAPSAASATGKKRSA